MYCHLVCVSNFVKCHLLIEEDDRDEEEEDDKDEEEDDRDEGMY